MFFGNVAIWWRRAEGCAGRVVVLCRFFFFFFFFFFFVGAGACWGGRNERLGLVSCWVGSCAA